MKGKMKGYIYFIHRAMTTYAVYDEIIFQTQIQMKTYLNIGTEVQMETKRELEGWREGRRMNLYPHVNYKYQRE